MPAASSDDARGASSAASVLAPSEGETEDPRISAYVAHLAHVGDEMAAGLGALFADAFPPTLYLFVSSVVFPGEAGTFWQLCSLSRQKQNTIYLHMTYYAVTRQLLYP